jgi:hypothetical protein
MFGGCLIDAIAMFETTGWRTTRETVQDFKLVARRVLVVTKPHWVLAQFLIAETIRYQDRAD